jgi:tRNA(Arg) A34 adenosine deaminase TadA
MTETELASRLLGVIERDILPMTVAAVEDGHNIFGGAVLAAGDLSLVVAGTNLRGEDPTFHGEIVTMNRFFRMKERPAAGDTVFLSTHEPCSMCLSALAWCGFRKIYFLFGYEETRDDFFMGDDLRMLSEIFATTVPSRKNFFFELVSLRGLIGTIPGREDLIARIAKLKKRYATLAEIAAGIRE